jgi:hypothetical protein
MVMLVLAALIAILRHHERPTRSRFVAAALLSAAAVFVKPGIATFFVLPFSRLSPSSERVFGSNRPPVCLRVRILTLLPALVFYA